MPGRLEKIHLRHHDMRKRALTQKLITILEYSSGFASLFQAIDKDGNGTINVSGELGETLIRLGIAVEITHMHGAIHKVCSRAGRTPDAFYGAGVSVKIPIYNELTESEFVDVMFILTTMTETQSDKMIKARTLFAAIDSDQDGKLDWAEFQSMMSYLDVQFDRETVQDAFEKVTADNDCYLDFKTFIAMQVNLQLSYVCPGVHAAGCFPFFWILPDFVWISRLFLILSGSCPSFES